MIRLKHIALPPTDRFVLQLQAHHIPFQREFRFCPERRFRADILLTGTHWLCEIEGGIWNGGRHVTGKGYSADIEKYNIAATLGYVVLRFTPTMVDDGSALECIQRVLKRAPERMTR